MKDCSMLAQGVPEYLCWIKTGPMSHNKSKSQSHHSSVGDDTGCSRLLLQDSTH